MSRQGSRSKELGGRLVTALLAALLCGVSAESRAEASTSSSTTTSSPSSTPADETILTRYGIRPRYDTSFRVNRQERSWSQTLAFSRGGGLANLNVSLNVKTREDETRNDFEEGINGLKISVGRSSRLGKLSFSTAANRRYTQTSQSLHSRDSDQLAFTNTLPLRAAETSSLNLSFGLGWVEDREVKENRRLTTTVDRTVATGWEADANLKGEWALHSAVSLDVGTNWNGSVQSSRTTHTEEGGGDAFEATDHRRDNRAFANLEWSRSEGLHVLLKTNWGDAVAQYYQASAETQETKRHNSRSVDLTADGAFAGQFGYVAKIFADRRQFDYQVEANDKLNATTKYELTLEYLPRLPLLRGGTLSGTASLSNKRSQRQKTTPSDIEGTLLEAKFIRPLGEQFTLTMRTRGDLEQYFYDDGSLDKDRLRLANQVFLRYKRGPGLRASLGYASNEVEEVHIPSNRAAQSQVKNDYRVTADYDAALPAGIRISQNFQISATYTYYVYDENRNALRRSNRVTTKLAVPLIEHSSISLVHIFEKADRGSYRYPESEEGRVYNKTQLDLRQNLSAKIEYTIAGAITLRVTEDLRITSNKQHATDAVTRREAHSFSGFVGLRRNLENGMMVTANFERTESNNEDPYWKIDARVQKTFD
ncbi:MAG: hypothetical protein KAY32_08775 [Candidatus Eisenbacteria sp.]|nr:hypothetical protein [Candidatus Eisenbacteria bacterium]